MLKILSAIDESKSVINSADEEGWVPLHSAASIGHLEIVEILLSRGRSSYFLPDILIYLFIFLLELLFILSILEVFTWLQKELQASRF